MVPRHVHVMDPQLQGQGGHYLNHDLQLVTDLLRRGLPVSLYGRKGNQLGSCAGLPVEPVFSLDIFKEVATDSMIWPMENFQHLNQVFLADLQSIPAERFSREDFVYFPNILQNQVLAVAQWLGALPEERRPSVGLMYRYLNHAMDYVAKRNNKDMIALYYRFASRELARVQPRTLVCADTRELATAYQNITGLPVLELPNPMDVSAVAEKLGARAPNERPVIVYQGHTSPLRGFHYIPDIVEGLRRHPAKPRFLVQLQNEDTVDTTGLRPVVQRLKAMQGPDLTIKTGALSNDDYYDMLLQADIVMLPYIPTFYGHGSSGVFTEAASLGKVVVVSEGTVPARQGREFNLGVVAAKAWNSPAMVEAMRQALDSLPALKARALVGAPAYRRENCAATLWDRVWERLTTLN